MEAAWLNGLDMKDPQDVVQLGDQSFMSVEGGKTFFYDWIITFIVFSITLQISLTLSESE